MFGGFTKSHLNVLKGLYNDYKDYKLKGKVHAPFSPLLMEFEIPKSVFDKMSKTTALAGRTKRYKKGDYESFKEATKVVYNYGMHGGIPKEFLKKVHK